MKLKLILLCTLALIITVAATTISINDKEVTTPEMQSKMKLRHVVMFKFKDTASKEDIKKVEEAFAALPSKIPAIKAFEWGLNNSPETFDKGFTHCFLLTFDSEEGRDEYLPHPAHKAFGEIVGPVLDDLHVMDYWTK
ncbi:MAG: Dabb family protein [Cyclobacteriaceae bacterium]|nr:Dabb family protein [Cyclobacteriaceae bacterium]